MGNSLINCIKKYSQHRLKFFSIYILVFILSVLTLAHCYNKYSPSFISGTYSYSSDSQSPESKDNIQLPLIRPSEHLKFKLDFILSFDRSLPKIFQIDSDSCIANLLVNGKIVEDPNLPACAAAKNLKLDLTEYVRPGENRFEIQASRYKPKVYFNLTVSKTDPGLILLQIIFYGLVLLLSFQGWRYLVDRQASGLVWLYLSGVAARILYVTATPTNVRGHDYQSHLKYIRYMAEHLSSPSREHCDVCYHPALYYLPNSLWYRYTWSPKINEVLIWNQLQMGSFLLSVFTLGVGLWLGTMLFSATSQKLKLYVFAAILCFFPGLVFFSSRINNDALLVFISFLLLAIIVRWWKTSCFISLLTAPILITLGLLTKKNIVVLFPAALLALFLHKKFSWRKKLITFLATIIIAFSAQSFVLSKTVTNVPSIEHNVKWLIVENIFSNLITFNPAQVIEHAYNRPGSDLHRRQYFLEFLYRSAFLGEFNFGDKLLFISRAMLALGMLLGLLAVGSLIREVSTNRLMDSLPIWLTFFCSVLALLSFRLKYPLACTQDFRYIPVVIIPVAYYIAQSLSEKSVWLHFIAASLCLIFVLTCISFFVMLHIY